MSDTKLPGLPATGEGVLNVLRNTWTLYYRYGAIPQLSKNFYLEGKLLDAINRGRQHCITMGYKFIVVRPFLIDLKEQEDRKEKGDEA